MSSHDIEHVINPRTNTSHTPDRPPEQTQKSDTKKETAAAPAQDQYSSVDKKESTQDQTKLVAESQTMLASNIEKSQESQPNETPFSKLALKNDAMFIQDLVMTTETDNKLSMEKKGEPLGL